MLDRSKDDLFGILEFMSKERSNGLSTDQTIIMFECCKNDRTVLVMIKRSD